MPDWEALIFGIAAFVGVVYVCVSSVLLAVRPDWMIRQWWSPLNRDRMRRSHKPFRWWSMDPDYISTGAYRLLGVVFVGLLAVIPLRVFGGHIGQTISAVVVGLFLLVWFLAIVCPFLPLSVLKERPWLTPGLPPSGEGLWVRRAFGAAMLALVGFAIYSAGTR